MKLKQPTVFSNAELARSHARVANDYLEQYATTRDFTAGRLAIDALTRTLVYVGRAQLDEPRHYDEMAMLGFEQMERLVELLRDGHKKAPADATRQGKPANNPCTKKPTSPATVSLQLRQIKACCPCPRGTDGLTVIDGIQYECPCNCHYHRPRAVVESVTWSPLPQACTA